jgi:hypothetical protein
MFCFDILCMVAGQKNYGDENLFKAFMKMKKDEER